MEEGVDVPRPLLKHRLTESKGAQSSERGVPVSAATCQMRAPSRCILMSLACAKFAISITSFCGMIVPLSVFSSSMTAVGQLYDA